MWVVYFYSLDWIRITCSLPLHILSVCSKIIIVVCINNHIVIVNKWSQVDLKASQRQNYVIIGSHLPWGPSLLCINSRGFFAEKQVILIIVFFTNVMHALFKGYPWCTKETFSSSHKRFFFQTYYLFMLYLDEGS